MTRQATMNRRTFVRGTAAATSAAVLAGCARGADGFPGIGGTSLTSAGWNDPITALMNGPVARGFKKATGIDLHPRESTSFGDFQTHFRTLLAGRTPPDVMRLNDDFLREVSAKHLSVDLTEDLASAELKPGDYFDDLFDLPKMASGRRAMVTGTQVQCIFYNKTMFEREGVPLPPTSWTAKGWSWDDFLDTARGLTKITKRGERQWGAVITKDTAYENTWSYNNGGDGIFSPDGRRFTLADPLGYQAIQWAADLALKHKVSPSWPDIRADQAEQRLFISGKLGMLMSASSTIANFTAHLTDFEWDIAPVPARVHQVQDGGVVVYAIPAEAKKRESAWRYLLYAIGEEAGRELAMAGLAVPVNREAALSLGSPGDYPRHIKLLIAGAGHSRMANSTTATAAAVALYRPQLQRVYTGELTARQALTSVRAQVEAAIRKPG